MKKDYKKPLCTKQNVAIEVSILAGSGESFGDISYGGGNSGTGAPNIAE